MSRRRAAALVATAGVSVALAVVAGTGRASPAPTMSIAVPTRAVGAGPVRPAPTTTVTPAAVGAGPVRPGTYAAAGRSTIARLQVTAREYTLTLSRGTLRTGLAIVELYNLGEDDHDLALRRVGSGAVTRRIAVTRPGAARDVELRLRAGRYRLWCTLLDHRARGMRGTLVVR